MSAFADRTRKQESRRPRIRHAKPRRAGAGAVFAALVATATLSGCASHITPEELQSRIDSANPPTIVDVRSTGEYEAGHVPGAIHLPFWTLAVNLDQLPESAADGDVVVYCEHGPRAGIARAQLWFANTGPVYYLEGHMSAWRDAGLPISTEK